MRSAHERIKDMIAVILGGGRGSRLDPLTRLRSKPAVPIAGKYRQKDHEKNESVITACNGLDYGFARSRQAGTENYKKSLKLKTNNKAVKIGQKKKKSLLDISSWLD